MRFCQSRCIKNIIINNGNIDAFAFYRLFLFTEIDTTLVVAHVPLKVMRVNKSAKKKRKERTNEQTKQKPRGGGDVG